MTAPGGAPVQAVEVRVPTAEVDLASGLLWGAGVAAIGELEVEDAAAGGGQGTVVLTTDVPAGGVEAIAAAIGGRWPVALVDVADDGLDGWRPYAEVARAGTHLVVVPPWVPYVATADDIVLAIDPGRSFGHGAHPTTRLCLAAVEALVGPGSSVLDVGCGSGVLAVAAARLGAAAVVAVDVDPEAVRATAANAAANAVAVQVDDRPVAAIAGTFDLVVANIGAATLVDLAVALADRVAAGGALVVSGLLAGHHEAVLAAFGDLVVTSVAEDGGWVAATLHRPRPD